MAGDDVRSENDASDTTEDDEPEPEPEPEYSEILSGAVKSGPLFFKVNILNYRKVTAGKVDIDCTTYQVIII